MSEFAALVVGPALAGLVIIPALGTVHLFTLDAATFVVSLLCVLALAPIARQAAHAAVQAPLPPTAQRADPAAHARRGAHRGPLGAAGGVRPHRCCARCWCWWRLDNLLLTGLAQIATPLLVKETLGLGNEAFAGVQTFFYLGLLVASGGFWVLGRRGPKRRTILVGIVLDGLTFLPLAFCHTLRRRAAGHVLPRPGGAAHHHPPHGAGAGAGARGPCTGGPSPCSTPRCSG